MKAVFDHFLHFYYLNIIFMLREVMNKLINIIFKSFMSRRIKATNTTRSKGHINMFPDLVTHSETTLAASSQASVFSKNSQTSFGTQSYQNLNDLQNCEQFIKESNQTLRISPQQQQRIQSILELARKGKINPSNAFEVPIKVANSEMAEDENNRFWKFASSLLSVSMNIYDKRVEHVYQGANRMHDSLVRFDSKQPASFDGQPEEKNRKQRGAILKIDLSELGDTQAIGSYDFASLNCEQPQKINVKKHLSYCKPDPMFNKTLQAFDSDSSSSLFMNVFETGNNHQISFFKDADKKRTYKQSQALEQSFSQMSSIDLREQSQTQSRVPTGSFPLFIAEDISKTNFLAQNNSTFSNLSNFLKQNRRQQLLQTNKLVQDFTSDFAFESKLDHSEVGDGLNQISFQESHFSMPQADITQISEDFLGKPFDEETTQYPMSEQFGRPRLFSSAVTMDDYEDLSPWQLEFKGMKLQKKKNTKKRGKRETKKNTDEFEIDFLDNKKESKINIIKPLKDHRQDEFKKNINKDKNQMPKNVDPFLRKFAHLAPASTTIRNTRRQEGFMGMTSDNKYQTQNLDVEHQDMGQGQEHEQAMDLIPLVSEGKQSQYFQDSQADNHSAGQKGIKNIRQVKQNIVDFIMRKKQVFLSELDIRFSEASALIIVLHLANENKVQIEDLDDDMLVRAL